MNKRGFVDFEIVQTLSFWIYVIIGEAAMLVLFFSFSVQDTSFPLVSKLIATIIIVPAVAYFFAARDQ